MLTTKSDKIEYAKSGAIMIIGSGNLTTHTANVGGRTVIPFDYEVVAAGANITQASGTAAGTIYCGTVADPDGIIDDYSVGTSHALGHVELPIATAGKYGTAGDVIEFGSDGAATTNGTFTAYIVVQPRSQRT